MLKLVDVKLFRRDGTDSVTDAVFVGQQTRYIWCLQNLPKGASVHGTAALTFIIRQRPVTQYCHLGVYIQALPGDDGNSIKQIDDLIQKQPDLCIYDRTV